MKSDRWREISQLYYATLERDETERTGFLEEACAGDEDLRREVESLLAAEEQAGDFLASPALDVAARAVAEEPPEALLGKKLGHYRIEKRLGVGGMGEVYLALDTKLNRPVALKMLRKEFFSDPERHRRFVQEARAASALDHPNIVTIHDIAEQDGVHFIVMQYVAGPSLGELIRSQRLDLEKALDLAIQMADGLARAHRDGIVHRDLKPDNVMVSEEGRAKIVDFGLAKLTEPQTGQAPAGEAPTVDKRPLTREGEILGTGTYMSPEQALGKEIDARSDIFSFGSVLYEMVTGQQAFSGESIASVLAAIMRDEPQRVSELVPTVPAGLENVINRALRKDRKQRFQSMEGLRKALLDVKEGRTLKPAYSQIVRIGDFEVDLEAGELREHGRKIKLQGKPVEILAILLERPGELVTREQLRERLWPDDVHVDYDGSLDKAIVKLRTALGDSAETPRLIETIPRRGYRFVGSLDKTVSPESGVPSIPTVTDTGRFKRITVAVAALMVIGFIGFQLSPTPEPAPASDLDPVPSKPSLAILPFHHLGASEDAAAFGLGMADTLITKLSNVSRLTVRPTSAVVGYLEANVDALEFARKLRVDHVLEGTLQRQGDRVRVSVRLLRVEDEQPLWAEVFEEEMNDFFELQDRISEQVTGELSLQLTGQEGVRLAKRPTPIFEAYEEYMRGRYFFEKRNPESLRKAIAAFERATELDPEFALAYAGIAHAYAPLITFGHIDSAEGTRKEKAAALRALELDDALAEVQTAVGVLHGADWNWEGEEQAYQKAIELNPNFPIAFMWYGYLLESHGRFEESLALRRKAWELDPTGLMANVTLGDSLYHAGYLEEAVAHFEKTLELAPDFDHAQISLGNTLMALGDPARAADLFEAAGDRTSLACARAQSGTTEEARAILEELRREAPQQYLSPYHVAAIHASLGETELAFAALEEAYAERLFVMSRMNIDWRLAPIKSDPRFADLARRVGLSAL